MTYDASEWKPGDVAMVTSAVSDPKRRIYGEYPPGENGRWYEGHGGFVRAEYVTEVRPLVVIDPEDAGDVARLADAFCHARWSHLPDSDECDPLIRSSMQRALREYANPTLPKCGASLTVTFGKAGAVPHRCAEPAGHDGPHLDGTCTWTAQP